MELVKGSLLRSFVRIVKAGQLQRAEPVVPRTGKNRDVGLYRIWIGRPVQKVAIWKIEKGIEG